MRVGASPRGRSKASARLWAGSVETIRVRWPAAAQRTAVAAATVVLPTPPLPVNSRTRTPSGQSSSLGRGEPSTRAFSSDSAVLMMRPSARRFTKPGMGIIRSTASS